MDLSTSAGQSKRTAYCCYLYDTLLHYIANYEKKKTDKHSYIFQNTIHQVFDNEWKQYNENVFWVPAIFLLVYNINVFTIDD